MNPVAFEIFGLQIRWYGIIIAGGVLAAFLLSSVLAKKKGVSFDDIVDAFIWAFPIAIVGARAYYVAFEFKNFNSFADMINIRTGGLAIHGGLIAGILTAYIVLKVKKVNFWEYIDVVMPAVVLAQGIGRWGNFMNQEAHGGAVSADFISKFPEFIQKGMLINGAYYHPTFLYESICDVLICLILIYILFKKKKYTAGEFKWGVNTKISYFPSDNTDLFQTDKNIIDWLGTFKNIDDPEALRSFLGRMLFSGDDVFKSVKVLSGGEKARCVLAKMMLEEPNVLLLDEPTNHLDLESITSLNTGLEKFQGELIFTSQDYELNDTVSNRIIEIFENGTIIDRRMPYSEYIIDEKINKLREENRIKK